MKTAAALLVALLIVCYAALYLLVRSDWVRLRVESRLSAATGHDVRIGTLRITPWLSFVASGLTVSKDGKVSFQAERIDGFFLPWEIFNGRIRSLSLDKPVLHLSLEELFNREKKTSPDLALGGLNIDDGALVLESAKGEPLVLRSIFMKARNVNLGDEAGLQLRTYVPAVSGRAELSVSRHAGQTRAAIVVFQGEEKVLTRVLPNLAAEKAVFKANFLIEKDDSGAYRVRGSGTVDQFRVGPAKTDGRFDSIVELDPKRNQVRFSADLKLPRFPQKLLPAELLLGSVSAAIRGDYSTAQNTLTFQQIDVASTAGASLDGEGAMALAKTPAQLNATLRLRNIRLDELMNLMPQPLRDLEYTGKAFADIDVTGAYNDPTIAGVAWNDASKAEGNQITVAQMALKVPFRWSGSSLEIEGMRFHGKNLSWGQKDGTQFKFQETILAADILKEAQKPLRLASEFQIIEGGFSVPGQSKAGERLRAKGRFTCVDCAGNASFSGAANVESLELLWSQFFGDFKEQRPAFAVAGSYHREIAELKIDKARVALASGGHVDLKGSVTRSQAGPAFDLEIQSDDLRNAGLYDFFARDAFKTNYPVLGRIGVAGKSALSFRVQGSPGAFTAEGKIRLDQGEIQERSGRWHVGPIGLELPFKLRFPQAAEKTSAPPAGMLSISGIKMPSSSVARIHTPLVLWNNALRFPEPIRISLFGGNAVIEELAWQDVIGTPRNLTFSLGLKDLALRELTEALGGYSFGGTLSGSIPKVHWAGDSLRSDGTMTLNVFGGRIDIRAMAVERPLSPLRSIAIDAELDGLNLEQASETFEFGRISGVLSGVIEDLVITRGEPAEFWANIHSVERPGVSQWISVEALNKITVISSGNDAGSIYGGIAGFFDFFRYSKLGFKAALRNDKLTLRGIETRNGQEYLVVGTVLPPTVNIVSHTQEIGFSELMSRLERIQASEKSN